MEALAPARFLVHNLTPEEREEAQSGTPFHRVVFLELCARKNERLWTWWETFIVQDFVVFVGLTSGRNLAGHHQKDVWLSRTCGA